MPARFTWRDQQMYANNPRYRTLAPQVLEIPSVYNTPSRQQIFKAATGQGTTPGDCCPCGGQSPSRWPQDQTPYSMPNQPGLDQPQSPQKPFQPISQDDDPCQPTVEALKGMGIDTDCLSKLRPYRNLTQRRLFPGATSSQRRRRKANGATTKARKARTRKMKLRSYRNLTQRRLFPGATSSAHRRKSGGYTRINPDNINMKDAPYGDGRFVMYRTGSGSGRVCYDRSTGKFTKMQNCVNARQ